MPCSSWILLDLVGEMSVLLRSDWPSFDLTGSLSLYLLGLRLHAAIPALSIDCWTLQGKMGSIDGRLSDSAGNFGTDPVARPRCGPIRPCPGRGLSVHNIFGPYNCLG